LIHVNIRYETLQSIHVMISIWNTTIDLRYNFDTKHPIDSP